MITGDLFVTAPKGDNQNVPHRGMAKNPRSIHSMDPSNKKEEQSTGTCDNLGGAEGSRAEWKSHSQELAYLTWQNYGAGEQTGGLSGTRVGEGKEVAEDVKSRAPL